ncbi:MAG: hypothetical protein ACHQ9S_01840 [Candidatus Binatia bacterium]
MAKVGSLVNRRETTLGLSPLNDRDANADDMSDSFDFNQQPADAAGANPGA